MHHILIDRLQPGSHSGAPDSQQSQRIASSDADEIKRKNGLLRLEEAGRAWKTARRRRALGGGGADPQARHGLNPRVEADDDQLAKLGLALNDELEEGKPLQEEKLQKRNRRQARGSNSNGEL